MFAELQFSKIDNNELATRNEINRSIFVDMWYYRILGNVLPTKYQDLSQVFKTGSIYKRYGVVSTDPVNSGLKEFL